MQFVEFDEKTGSLLLALLINLTKTNLVLK